MPELKKKPLKRQPRKSTMSWSQYNISDKTRGKNPRFTNKFYADLDVEIDKLVKKKMQHKNPRKRKKS